MCALLGCTHRHYNHSNLTTNPEMWWKFHSILRKLLEVIRKKSEGHLLSSGAVPAPFYTSRAIGRLNISSCLPYHKFFMEFVGFALQLNLPFQVRIDSLHLPEQWQSKTTRICTNRHISSWNAILSGQFSTCVRFQISCNLIFHRKPLVLDSFKSVF